MSGYSGPSKKCKYLPSTYSRFNTKKSKYGKKIINNIYINNQYISINNSNINQYNYNNFQFHNSTCDNNKPGKSNAVGNALYSVNSELEVNHNDFRKIRTDTSHEVQQKISEQKQFELSPQALSFCYTNLPSNSVLHSTINKFNLENTSDLTVKGAIDFKGSVHDGLSCVVKKSKGNNCLRDLTNRSQDKLINLNANYLMINSPPDAVCALSKCFRFDLKGKRKMQKKKKKVKELLKSQSKMKTPPRKPSSHVENDSLSSSGTSTPFCEKILNKTNWGLSPIELYHKKGEKMLQNDSLELISFKTPDVPVFPDNNITKRISKLLLDENNSESEENDNFNGRNLRDSNIKKYVHENDGEPSVVCAGKDTCRMKQKSDYSDDIFESMSSFSTDTMETISTDKTEKGEQSLPNDSLELISFVKPNISVSSNNNTKKYISEVLLCENNFESEKNYNLNGRNLSNIKKHLNKNGSKSSIACTEEENTSYTKQKSEYSEDNFQSICSISTDKTEITKTETKSINLSDTILLPYLGGTSKKEENINEGNKESSKRINSTNCNKYNKTSIGTNIDSCDFQSTKSFTRLGNIDNSVNSLNMSFDNVYDCENCDDKGEQYFATVIDGFTSECYTKIIPGKKWKRSLLAVGKRDRVTLACGKENLNFSATSGWNIRFSLNPQSNNYCRSSIKKSSRLTSNTQIAKFLKIKEQSFPEDEEIKLHTDTPSSNSFFDCTSGEKIDYNSDRDEDNEEQDGEFDFTFVIHQHVANILQKDDLNKTLLSVSPTSDDHKRYAKENVFKLCGLTSPVTFCEAYSEHFLRHCKKIGEGIFGEVFCYFPPNLRGTTVLKIIPIEGDKLVNCSPQKTYSEVFSEMCIAFSLSRLKNCINGNYTDGFCSLLKMTCLKGKYPKKLVMLWNEYDKTKCSENDSPIMFDSEQLYIGLEMSHGGEPLESYQFSSARQSYSILLQVIHSLAVAEKAYEFEHRDLHWGNVLVSKTNNKKIKYMIDGITYYISSYGKKSTVIDYTLSRISSGNFDIYNDISKDEELFQAYGDYQFEIYRSMREDVKNNWQSFVPKSNVRWIHYLASKCIKGVYYKNDHSIHQSYLMKIKCLRDKVLTYSSALDIVKSLNKK